MDVSCSDTPVKNDLRTSDIQKLVLNWNCCGRVALDVRNDTEPLQVFAEVKYMQQLVLLL